MRMTEVQGLRGSRLRARRRLTRSAAARACAAAPTLVLDSSGTVLDSMSARHSLAYFPAFAQSFFRGADPSALEEVWSFVALSSRSRSERRFRLLATAMRLAPRHPGIDSRYPREEEIAAALDQWIASSTKVSVSALEEAMRDRSSSEALVAAAIWSLDVDSRLSVIPPPKAFSGVGEALRSLEGRARIVVAGEGQAAELERDWRRAGLLGSSMGLGEMVFVGEDGGGLEEIALAAGSGDGSAVLVVGDSPADFEAARQTGAAFYPVRPGGESESWRLLSSDVFPAFLRGERIASEGARFMSAFSSSPSWLGSQRGIRPFA